MAQRKMNPMASTNAFLTLYSTVQTNLVGSTIATGYIPYVSTAGRQAYTNTPQVSTLGTSAASLPLQVGGVTYATLTSSGLSGVTSPTVLFSSKTSGTITVPAGVKTLWIRCVGGGGGGGVSGGATTISGTTISATGGSPPSSSKESGLGGVPTGGNINIPGGIGSVAAVYMTSAASQILSLGGNGGNSMFGSGATQSDYAFGSGQTASPATFGGGGSGSSVTVGAGGSGSGNGGSGGGGYCESYIPYVSSTTYTVSIGAGGGTAGQIISGAAGFCIVVGLY